MEYSLGLDIGITSVGWSVLDFDRERIADLGVRLFQAGENPKDGSSLAAPRREARSARRRLRRKRQRMEDIRSLLVSKSVLTHEQMDALYSRPHPLSPWELRTAGLDRLLSGEEWARVLIHIAKRRGFKSNRSAASGDAQKDQEDGRAKQAMSVNAELLSGAGGKGYRTVGEMMQCDEKFAEHKRNKRGDYSCSVTRAALTQEIKVLFECQRSFGNPFASHEIENKYLGIFSSQLPFASGDQIEKMVGRCTLEPGELRAPKASWTAERFILLGSIANLRVRVDGRRAELRREKMEIIEKLAYKKAKVTYKDIRRALDADGEWTFESLPRAKEGKDPEDAVFAELKGFHAFKKTISAALGKEYWDTLITTSPEMLDALACALTFRKTDDDILQYLEERGVERKLAEAVLSLNFSKCVNLSLKAMGRLIPFMEAQGCRYDEACALAGYSHYAPGGETERSPFLPVPDWEGLRNPVVIRAVAQTRKVVNAIIRRYGPPTYIQIELARELSHSAEERKKIEKEQNENRDKKDALALDYAKQFGYRPNGLQLEKYRLWKEQAGFCPYTGEYIDPELAFAGDDGSYAEIDHIIPYSRSFDDSLTNKVLVIGSANRNKGDRTPYEFFGGDGEAWEAFAARVEAYIKNKRRAARLMTKDFGESEANEMKARALGDTRHITSYVADWLEKNLLFADETVRRPVTRVNGRATAVMRRQWGINALKDRRASDLHHALDACVIAAATTAIIQKISEYSRKRELCQLKKESAEGRKTRFPEPWANFRKEIEARLSDDPAAKIREFGLMNYTGEELEELKPVFISRKPDRSAAGAAHAETVRSAKYLDEGKTAVKTPLTSVTPANLENMVGKERDRALYEALKKRLEECGGKPDKAFAKEFRKPTKDGSPGPVVRSIKIFSSGTSGVLVRGGIAANERMVRVDVYSKSGKYYLIPYYVSDIAAKIVKDRAITPSREVRDWIVVDSSYSFVYSLCTNDLLRVIDSKGKEIFGYYVGCDIATGAITVKSHDGSELWRGIGMRTAKSIEKYEVDVLGDYHKVKKEKPPHELA